MSFIRYGGDPGTRIDIGPFKTADVVDATTITSVIMRVSHRNGEHEDWDATLTSVSATSVTASTVTQAGWTDEPGLYRIRCYFYVDAQVVFAQEEEIVFRFIEGSAPYPTQAPPYDGWELRIVAAEQAAAALDVRVTELEALELRVDALETTEVAEPVAVTMDRNQSIDLTGTGATHGTSLAISLAASGHVDNTTTSFFIGAYSRTAVAWSPDLRVEMVDGSAFVFDTDRDLVVEATRVFGRTYSKARYLDRSSRLGEQIMLATVPTAQPDTIELWGTGALKFATLAQVSISGSMAIARTITAIKSGNGTSRVILQLSGALDAADAVSIVFGASHTLADLSSRRILAQSLACFWYAHPTELAGFTMYRDAQYELSPVAPDGDGTWLAPTGPDGQLVDATSIGQIYADRQPDIASNGYHGAAAVKCRGIPVVATNATDLFTVSALYDMPANDTPLMLICGFADYVLGPGSMPTGLAANTARYVVNANTSARTFQLSATPGGAAATFTSDGADLYALFQTLNAVTTMASLVSASASTCWAAFRGNRITTTNPGAVYNRQACVSATSTFGWSVDKGAGADTCVVGAHGLDATSYQVADVPAEEGAPMLVRHRHASGNLYARRDRLSESAATPCTNFTSLSGNLNVGARVGDMQGACDSDTFCVVTTNAVQTAQMTEGIESFFTLQPWGRFLRHDLLDMPEVKDAVVGRVARLYWNQLHESAGGISQYTYACSGGGATDADGWSFTPAGGDVGSRTITIVASLGGRPVATRSFALNVIAAATTGTCRLLQIGDSWTHGFTLPDTVRANLVADGLTVTTLGSVGGRVVSVNATTNVWTSAGHGYTDNEPVDFAPMRNPGYALPTAVGGDIAAGVTYYIEAIDATTFGLRRTNGGARIDVTNTGTGQAYIRGVDEKNEGRGGWKVSDYMDAPGHLTEGASPFQDPATGLWSWSYYQSTHCGGVDPDLTIVQLLINGLLGGSNIDGSSYTLVFDDLDSVDAMIDLQLGHMERFVRGMLAGAPAMKIVMLNPSLQCSRQGDIRANIGAQPPEVISQDKLQRIVHRLRRRVLEQFGGREAERLYVADGAAMDRTNDYASPDSFHPVTVGYGKQADNLAATARRGLAA